MWSPLECSWNTSNFDTGQWQRRSCPYNVWSTNHSTDRDPWLGSLQSAEVMQLRERLGQSLTTRNINTSVLTGAVDLAQSRDLGNI